MEKRSLFSYIFITLFFSLFSWAHNLVVATPIAEDSAQVEAIELPAPTLGVQVNGDMLDFSDASPVIENNRVFVPFRAVF